MVSISIILSCEYAGNQVPIRYRSLFETDKILDSPEGWDPGALDITVALSESLDLLCFTHQTTRLLVDVNRSLGHPQLFSSYSKGLGDEDKQMLLDKYYFPYRLRVENALAMLPKPALHFSIHTFTPTLHEQVQIPDIGILFDPTRVWEKSLVDRLHSTLELALPDLRIELNEPYQGTDDGFIPYLRTRFSDEEYAGIALLVNQNIATNFAVEKINVALAASLLPLRS
jgi:predicted N-formylglutamate amidohydrolase